jgi:hypothetical protein
MAKESAIARAAGLTEPVAIVWTDEKPAGALELKAGVWGCVMWMYAKVVREGKTAAFSRDTIGCAGAAMGFGFGRPFDRHACRSEQGFCSFLSNGLKGAEDKQAYSEIINRAFDAKHKKMLTEGERLMKGPDVVRSFLRNLPLYDIPANYVVMKPITEVTKGEEVKSVIFLADADQLSALSILANYSTGRIRDGVVVAAGAAGCQAIGVCTYAEGEENKPRAVVGLTDLAARNNVRKQLGKDKLTFSVPYALYKEMESNVPGSFFETPEWKGLMEGK